MPIRSPKWWFVAALVLVTPDAPGVFELWDGDEVVYVGATRGVRPSLRQALVREMALHDATHFSWEITYRAATRELELLEEYIAENHHPPRLNASA